LSRLVLTEEIRYLGCYELHLLKCFPSKASAV
jgi:hypothetical protein